MLTHPKLDDLDIVQGGLRAYLDMMFGKCALIRQCVVRLSMLVCATPTDTRPKDGCHAR